MNGRVICHCGAEMRLYARGPHGPWWGCERRPECDGAIGADDTTHAPLGIPVPKSVREARVRAHAAFDPLWSGKGSAFRGRRQKAYRWLARELGLSPSRCHIARFDADMCARVIEACDLFMVARREKAS